MRALTASELLDVWERGLTRPPHRRALALLGAACDGVSPEALARLSAGRRDGLLMELRELTFGPQLTGLAGCPGCRQQLELNIEVNDLRVAAGEGAQDAPEILTLGAEGYEVSFRLPNSLDLEAAARGPRKEIGEAGQLILERCLLKAERGGESVAVSSLPDKLIEAISERLARADPQADVRLALSCPECGARWQEQFDIGSFFWGEIHAWAERLLREVHTLASRYGWREADIIGMSASRRRLYLDLING
jgi:hypothetical protein